MVLKMEKWCRSIIDKMEKGERGGDHQMFLMMLIFGSTYNLEYREKLFNVWPNYLQDMTALEYKYPEVVCDELDALKLPKESKILDMACGPGNVGVLVIIPLFFKSIPFIISLKLAKVLKNLSSR